MDGRMDSLSTLMAINADKLVIIAQNAEKSEREKQLKR